jgi:hypothetical protein
MTTSLDHDFLHEVREGLRRYDFLDTRTMLAETIGALQVQQRIRDLEPGLRHGFDDLTARELYLDCTGRTDDLGLLCRVHWLTEICVRVIQVDGEDFVHVDDWLDVPVHVQDVLRASSLPHRPDDPDRGVLDSMLPMFRLLLELIDVAYERDDIDVVLKYLHLLAEYAPMLVWEQGLQSPGEPAVIGARITAATPAWDDPGRTSPCPRKDAAGAVARTAPLAMNGEREWGRYIDRALSRVSLLLQACGTSHDALGDRRGCREPCGMAPTGPGAMDMARRLQSVRSFADSSVVKLRHPSPLGHGFRLPDKGQVDAAWDDTRARLARAEHFRHHPPPEMDSWGALHGLASMVTYWSSAQEMQEATTVLADMRDTALGLLPA